jgi:hypothetical protein
MKDDAKKPPQEPRGLSEAQLDEVLEETFPASDPPATSPTSVSRPDPSRSKDHRRSGRPSDARA